MTSAVLRLLVLASVLLGVSLCLLPATVAQPAKKDPLADRVRLAIQRGVKYLRDLENGRGELEKSVAGRIVPGGLTALGTLAMLNAGVPPDDPALQRLLAYLRTVPPDQT